VAVSKFERTPPLPGSVVIVGAEQLIHALKAACAPAENCSSTESPVRGECDRALEMVVTQIVEECQFSSFVRVLHR